MTITRCVLPFSRELDKLPHTPDAYRAALSRVPEACPHPDCSPGGCRAHCREYATGAWVRGRGK